MNNDDHIYRDEALRPPSRPVPEPRRRPAADRRYPQVGFFPGSYRARSFASEMRRFAGAENENEADLNERIVFYRMFPTYADMDDATRRAYFAFRTLARRGDLRAGAPVAFARVYAYELIALSGTPSPEEAYRRLKKLGETFDDPVLKSDVACWLRDMAVVYDLGAEFARDAFGDIIRYDALKERLLYCRTASDGELFEAMRDVSSYPPEKAALFKTEPERFAAIAAAVYRRAAEYFTKNHMGRLSQRIVGAKMLYDCDIFANALWEPPFTEPSHDYRVDPSRGYFYINRHWRVESIGKDLLMPKSRLMGEIVHETDRITRGLCGTGKPIKPFKTEPWLTELVTAAVKERLAAEREASRPVVSIDLSKLEGIRRDADVTRDRLLESSEFGVRSSESGDASSEFGVRSSEFEDGKDFSVPSELSATAADLPSLTTSELTDRIPREGLSSDETVGSEVSLPTDNSELRTPNSELTETESVFLRLLLTGGDAGAFAVEKGLFPSVVADGINEKLFDFFSDTVIEETGDGFVIVEDYADELAGMISPGGPAD